MKNTRLLVISATLVFAAISSFVFWRSGDMQIFSDSHKDAVSLADISENWEMKLNDKTECYNVNVQYVSNYGGTLSDFVFLEVLGGLSKNRPKDLNTYGFNSPSVFDMGQQGVGNYNTIYVLSRENRINLIEVNSAISEFQAKGDTETECPELRPVIEHLVGYLLQ